MHHHSRCNNTKEIFIFWIHTQLSGMKSTNISHHLFSIHLVSLSLSRSLTNILAQNSSFFSLCLTQTFFSRTKFFNLCAYRLLTRYIERVEWLFTSLSLSSSQSVWHNKLTLYLSIHSFPHSNSLTKRLYLCVCSSPPWFFACHWMLPIPSWWHEESIKMNFNSSVWVYMNECMKVSKSCTYHPWEEMDKVDHTRLHLEGRR